MIDTEQLFEQLFNKIKEDFKSPNFELTFWELQSCYNRLLESSFWYKRAIQLKKND